jgi:hypothetical protein
LQLLLLVDVCWADVVLTLLLAVVVVVAVVNAEFSTIFKLNFFSLIELFRSSQATPTEGDDVGTCCCLLLFGGTGEQRPSRFSLNLSSLCCITLKEEEEEIQWIRFL